MFNLESILVEEKVFQDGYGFALWCKHRNLQTWYSLETWKPNDNKTMQREYYNADAAFTAIEAMEKSHLTNKDNND